MRGRIKDKNGETARRIAEMFHDPIRNQIKPDSHSLVEELAHIGQHREHCNNLLLNKQI